MLIVIDCLRKANLSLYGYDRDTTPFLRSLNDRAAVFENAVAPSPWTYPSVTSMLTGLYPHRHGGDFSSDLRNFVCERPNKVIKDVLSLPELLCPSGFQSFISTGITPAAMAACGWFKSSNVFLGGIEHHLGWVLRRLKSDTTRRTFTYFHVSNLHDPIDVPASHRDTFGTIADIPKLDRWQFQKNIRRGESSFEQYRENRMRLYDCALRFVDGKIAELFEFLEKQNILDKTVVFITADHGEEFWEHAELEQKLFHDPRDCAGISHGHNLFQEVISIPLICIGPGIIPGHYQHKASLIDLAPTIADICGIDHGLSFDGRNLFICSDERHLFSEAIAFGYEKKAVLQRNWKLIHSAGDNVTLLFDLSKDPREEQDLAKVDAQKVAELKTLLPKTRLQGMAVEIDKDIEDQLRHLGYM